MDFLEINRTLINGARLWVYSSNLKTWYILNVLRKLWTKDYWKEEKLVVDLMIIKTQLKNDLMFLINKLD
jgi:hypothetical protein